MIINRGATEVDNHISRNDFFDYYPLKNVIFILLYRTLFLLFLTKVGEVSKDNTMRDCYNRVTNG